MVLAKLDVLEETTPCETVMRKIRSSDQMEKSMDSRLLYIMARRLSETVVWDKEWIHFGTGQEINLTLVTEVINNFLMDDHLNFVYNRGNSGSYQTKAIMGVISDLLGKDTFQLWNSSMDKVIKFQSMGVLLPGRRQNI